MKTANWIITSDVGQFATSSLRERDWKSLRTLGATIEYRPAVLSPAEIVKVIKSRRHVRELDNLSNLLF
jgi:hypothetical protein